MNAAHDHDTDDTGAAAEKRHKNPTAEKARDWRPLLNKLHALYGRLPVELPRSPHKLRAAEPRKPTRQQERRGVKAILRAAICGVLGWRAANNAIDDEWGKR